MSGEVEVFVTQVFVGYGNGFPLETSVAVELLAEGNVVATANPDADGLVTFRAKLVPGRPLSIRLQESGTT